MKWLKAIGIAFVVLALLCILIAAFLPVNELLSMGEYRLLPAYAKNSHFVRLKKSATGTVVYVLGTAHEHQFKPGTKYPFWELRSVLEALRPSLTIVEIRKEAIIDGRWGEGSPEMPYVVAIAQSEKLKVEGMDSWHPGDDPVKNFEDREDQMAANILGEIPNQTLVLVLADYSHLRGLSRRLIASGFEFDRTFSTEEKSALFSHAVPRQIPASFFEAINRAAADAESGKSDYPKEWAQKTRALINEPRPH